MFKIKTKIIIICFFAVPVISFQICNAQWIKDGVEICPADSFTYQWQWEPAIMADGIGGAIISWQESRYDVSYNLYAQRIDKNGYLLWKRDGIAICMATGNQLRSHLIPDGTGGAIISWIDARSGKYDIYAQRIDSTGVIQWSLNGVGICTAPGNQYSPCSAPDGSGGFYFVWWDDREVNRRIYCQQVDSYGNAQWINNGIPINSVNSYQGSSKIVTDEKGNAIVVWEDERYGTFNSHIFGQKVDKQGNRMWASNGVDISPYCAGWDLLPQILLDNDSGVFVVWQQGMSESRDIYAQRVDSSGALLWPNSGLAISLNPGDYPAPKVASDGYGGMIITWLDTRSGRDDIYAQLVSEDGVCQWASKGVLVFEGSPSMGIAYSDPRITTDEAHGAIISWMGRYSTESSWDIFAQRIDDGGAILWTAQAIIICSAEGWQYYPQIVRNNESGAIITWQDERLGDDKYEIYAMRVTADGQTVATMLESFDAYTKGASVFVEWTLSEIGVNMKFIILRAEMPKGVYDVISDPVIHRQDLSFFFIDRDCEPAKTYCYRLLVVDENGYRLLFQTDPMRIAPVALKLYQNYPNPFNPSTIIRYSLPSECNIDLGIYNISGQLVINLVNDRRSPGLHSEQWNGMNRFGMPASSGIYLYRLRTGKRELSRKMILIR